MTDLQQVKNGIVCFTFDDSRYKDWLPLIPLFKKFNAHCTFFFSGELDNLIINAMKQLTAHGHSVGLHTLHHRDADTGFAELGAEEYVRQEIKPQSDVCNAAGIPVRWLGYPNCRSTPETDSYLMKHCGFERVRIGMLSSKPKGYQIAEQDELFLDLDKIPTTRAVRTCTYGAAYYQTAQSNLDHALERAARENRMLCLTSHGISDNPGPVDVALSMQTAAFQKAFDLGMQILSYDDLPLSEQ